MLTNTPHFNVDRQTTNLSFPLGDPYPHEIAEFYIRGGVCWPITVERDDGHKDFEGFAIMAGQNIKTKQITVFDQRAFVCIDNIVGENSVIEYPGLAPWLNECWAKYFGEKFYWHQDWQLAKTYRLDVHRSKMVKPKPQFIEIEWANDEDIEVLIWKYVKMGRLVFQEGSDLDVALRSVKKGEKETLPPVHALACLLAGIERHPWRERKAA